MRYAVLLVALVSSLWIGTHVPPSPEPAAIDPATITEWEVPWENTRPRDPYVDRQDRVWFVGQRGNYAAYLTPSSGDFERFDLPEGTGPHNLIVDAGGTVWLAGNRDAYIGAMDPETGEVTRYDMPNDQARDPHTLVFDPAGDIWFTVQGGNFVGKLTTATGEVALIEVPTPRARPYGIVTTDEGRPWFTEFGANKLATVDPETMELEEITLPREDARPRRLDVTSDGLIWYVDYAEGYLGRYDPESGEFEEWRVPSGADSRPYGMVVDDEDRLWFVETGPDPNLFVGFDPGTEEFFSTAAIESGGGTVRHMFYDEETDAVWFGADTNTIGRAELP